MLKQIHLKNYKAFEDASIQIKPITLFLGANSAGKSSIIQFLLMLLQTASETRETYHSPLKLYGDYLNLGNAKNLFRNYETSQELEFELVLSAPFFFDEIYRVFNGFLHEFKYLLRFTDDKQLYSFYNDSLETKESFYKVIDLVYEQFNHNPNQLSFYIQHLTNFDKDSFSEKGIQGLKNTFDILNYIVGLKKTSDIVLHYSMQCDSDNVLSTQSLSFSIDEKSILSIVKKNKILIDISSDIIDIDKETENVLSNIYSSGNPIFTPFNRIENIDKRKTDLSIILYKIVSVVLSNFMNCINKDYITHVSPLRAQPQRYYMLDKSKFTKHIDTLNGDEIAEALKDNKKLEKKVNNWLFQFGFEVEVKEFKEVVHHVMVKQNDLMLDISDVGFGISQLLPIIIQGFLAVDNSITIIEQPEIHLHPRMQADLADLFIDMVHEGTSRNFIIETHSEYLLKRLRRRISEGRIKPQEVSICLFHPQKDGTSAYIEELEIGEKGSFSWPTDYYSGELLEDSLSFLRNQ